MIRDLEEAVEDALVEYFKVGMPGNVNCYAYLSNTVLAYPALIVGCITSDQPEENAIFDGHRKMEVMVDLIVEAADELDINGTVFKGPREINRELRRAMWELLAIEDLHGTINDAGYPGVLFSMVHPTRSERGTDETLMTTSLMLEVEAQSTE